MANGNKLYQAYRGAGKSAASYKASLYDIENLGIERESSAAQHQYRMQKMDENTALVSEAIGLASDIYGGFKSKEEAKTDRANVSEGMAKKSYAESEAEKLKKDKTYKSTSWNDLDPDIKKSQISNFGAKEVERDWVGKLFGEEKKYTFGGGTDEFSSSEITAASKLYKEDSLSSLINLSSSKGIPSLENKESSNILNTETTKKEDSSISFGQAFKAARDEGLKEFEWEGKMFHTRTKDEEIKMGGSYAKGGEFTTDGPELILVGDNPGGKEKVKVKPIKAKSKSNKKEMSKGEESLSNNVGESLSDLVSRKGMRPGSKNWINNYISTQKVNNEPLRPLRGQLSKHNEKLFSMAEESGYFGEFFRGGWE